MNLIVVVIGLTLAFAAFMGWKIKRASDEIDRLFKANEQLEREKNIAQTQVKNHQIKENYEKNHRTSARDELIDRLQQSGDLRD